MVLTHRLEFNIIVLTQILYFHWCISRVTRKVWQYRPCAIRAVILRMSSECSMPHTPSLDKPCNLNIGIAMFVTVFHIN